MARKSYIGLDIPLNGFYSFSSQMQSLYIVCLLQQPAAAQTASIASCSNDQHTSQQSVAYQQSLSKQENSCGQTESKVTHRTIKGKGKKVKYVLFIHYLLRRPSPICA